jgi:hypothetical protein
MRLSQARLLVASTTALAVGAGVPAILVTSASAATSHGSAVPSAANAANAATAKSITSTVTGTFRNKDGKGHFKGTFTPTHFKVVKGVLEATGRLKGTLTNADGKSLGTVTRTVALPVKTSRSAAAPAACNVLNLVLGPLHLNLLGLVVDLNQVHLNITAVPGSLLGDLLCDIAHLLNSGGSLNEVSTLLNEVLSLS